MLTIRLTRKGKKNQPFFSIVVIDKRKSSKGGRNVEVLGFVDPLTKRKNIDKERAAYWISKGAQPSATIANLFIEQKIMEGKKVHVSKLSKKKQAEIDAKKAEEQKKSEATAEPAPAQEPEAKIETPEAPAA